MTARTTASKKGKARRLQQTVRDLLISELGIHADDILSAPMGLAGCDIVLSSAARAKCPFGIECKNQEVWKIPEWWRQCTTNADQENLSPLLIIKKNGQPPLAVIEWHRLVSLLADQCSSNADCDVLRGEDARRFHEAMNNPQRFTTPEGEALTREAMDIVNRGDIDKLLDTRITADRVDDLELLELRRYREANREKELHADRPDEVVE